MGGDTIRENSTLIQFDLQLKEVENNSNCHELKSLYQKVTFKNIQNKIFYNSTLKSNILKVMFNKGYHM